MNNSAVPPVPPKPSKPNQNPPSYPPPMRPPPNQPHNQPSNPLFYPGLPYSGGRGGGGGGGGQALPSPTIKFDLKLEILPRWNGDRRTAISYFWKCQHLALFGGQMPELLGHYLWRELDEDSDAYA